MKNDHLILMANQIGSFFKSYPDKDYAAKEIAAHMTKFWAPRMREAIKNLDDNSQSNSLDDLVRTAIKQHL